jgi:ADP-heptose:LPS heptosyltransferase
VNRSKGKILIIRGGAIGDFILTLPVLSALRARFPETQLEVLGYPHIAQLAVAGGLADAVRYIEGRALAGFFARDGLLDPELCCYFSGFHIIVSYLYDPDEIFATNVRRTSTAQYITGPHRPDETRGVHAAESLLQPLVRLAIYEADPVPRLPIVVPVTSAPRLALHPGSGSEKKNWPEAKWAELLRLLLTGTKTNLLLVGGEAEGARLDRLARLAPPERLEIARGLPLTELAERLRGCGGFVGHDSGITHLAASLGVRTVALWGPSVELVWRPRGDHVEVVKSAEGLSRLTVDEVLARIRSALPNHS